LNTDNNSEALARMKELISILNAAGEAYYARDTQAVTDYQ